MRRFMIPDVDRRTVSSKLTSEAVSALDINLPTNVIRCLMNFTRGMATRVAVIKQLRKVVADYRTHPSDFLQQKGIGKKTFAAVDELSRALAGNETMKEFGVAQTIDGAVAMLKTINRGVDDATKKNLDLALLSLSRANHTNEKYRAGIRS